jgi:cytochrome c peroxidase
MLKRILIFFSVTLSLLFVNGIFSCQLKKEKKAIELSTDLSLINLGRYLFYDRRLSINNTRSCATCHNPQFAFTDGYKRSLGAFADLHQRNTQPLFNLSSFKYFTSADSTVKNTMQQMNNPLFNNHPVEMGMGLNEEKIVNKIKQDSLYKKLFTVCFSKDKEPINLLNIKEAINNFILTIQSNNAPYDKFLNGDSHALSVEQKQGMQLFFSDKLKCKNCHGGFNFNKPAIVNVEGDTLYYFNIGLYNIDGKGSYPLYDQGLFQLTKKQNDMGAFRVPTLRNLSFTAPYFHDGSVENLKETIEVFATGGRIISKGENAGNGIKNPYKHPFINGFAISEKEKTNLIKFLIALSDSSQLKNPTYQNPFTEDETKRNSNLHY